MAVQEQLSAALGGSRTPLLRRSLLVLSDTFVLVVAVVLGLAFDGLSSAPDHPLVIALVLPTWLGILVGLRTHQLPLLYSFDLQRRAVRRSAMTLMAALAVALAVPAARDTGLGDDAGIVLGVLALGVLGLEGSRAFWSRRWVEAPQGHAPLFIIGTLDGARELAAQLGDRHALVGICAPGTPDGVARVGDCDVPVTGDLRTVGADARVLGARAVVVSSTAGLSTPAFQDLHWQLEPAGLELIVVPGIHAMAPDRVTRTSISGLPALHIRGPRYAEARRLGKRTLDVALTVPILLVAALPMALVALAIKLDDGGRVFYKQCRIGLGGNVFEMWKFRSMVPNAAVVQRAERTEHEVAHGFIKHNSPALVTRVGRVLRKTSLDELPQLFNVLGGSMSLVGPRPLAPEEGSEIPGFVQRRVLVRPGMTGLWQVSGRSDTDPQTRVRLDLHYVENWSLAHDLGILARTAKVVVRGDGAY